jgi:hypothetical protein
MFKMIVLVFSFTLAFSSQAVELGKCFDRVAGGPATTFNVPESVCIDIAAVFWRFDYPTHVIDVTGTYNNTFELEDFGLTDNDLWLVEATLNKQKISAPGCFTKSSAALKFRFEVSDDTTYILNPEIRMELLDTDASCRISSVQAISYKVRD